MKSLDFTAIYTIWLREMKRFLRARSRLIGSLAMPLFFLLFLGMGFDAAFRFSDMPPGVNYIAFLAPVSRVSIVLGKTLGGMTTALLQGFLILLIAMGIGFKITGLLGFLSAVICMILIATSFVCLGLIFASIINDMQGFHLIMTLFTFPIFILSSALFPLERLPLWLKYLSYINPLTYGVDGLRYSLIGMAHFSLILDLFVLVCFCIFMIGLSTYFFGNVEVD